MQAISIGDDLFSPQGCSWKCDCVDECDVKLINTESGDITWLTLDELNEQRWWNLSRT